MVSSCTAHVFLSPCLEIVFTLIQFYFSLCLKVIYLKTGKPISNPYMGLFARACVTRFSRLGSCRIKLPIKKSTKILEVEFLYCNDFSPCSKGIVTVFYSVFFHLRRLILRGCVEKIRQPHSYFFPLIWPQLKKVAWSSCFSPWLQWAGPNRTPKFHQLPYSGLAPSYHV